MKRIRYYFASKKLQMAQLHDLQRQLQEAWDDNEGLEKDVHNWKRSAQVYQSDYEYVKDMLHRVARERDNERKLRLEAEKLRDVYLEQLENEEE